MRALHVLVTGSRDWTDRGIVHGTLSYALLVARYREQRMHLWHGKCPSGADAFAHEWAQGLPVAEHAYPAMWDTLSRRAGMARNVEMVHAMMMTPDDHSRVVVGFNLGTPGTTGCLKYARTLAGRRAEVIEHDGHGWVDGETIAWALS